MAVAMGQVVATLALAHAAAIAVLVAAATLMYRGASGQSPVAWLRASVQFALPLSLVGVLSWVFNLGDRYLIASLASASEVGRYAAAYGIAASGLAVVGGIVPTLMMRPLFRAAASADNAQRSYLAVRTILVQSGIVAIAVVAIWLAFAAPLTQILLASEYRAGAVVVMRWVALGQGFVVLAQALDLDSYSRFAYPVPLRFPTVRRPQRTWR